MQLIVLAKDVRSTDFSHEIPLLDVVSHQIVKAYTSDQFPLQLPPGHRFPASKYALLREAVSGLSGVDLRDAPPATWRDLEFVHDARYLWRVRNGYLSEAEQRDIGFPWSQALVLRSLHSAGGTLAAAVAALDDGVAMNLAGGTHHAHADQGQGFCLFNDAALAVRVLQRERGAALLPVAVIDLDVHQGDGTAAILGNDAHVFTLSIHAAKNFPFCKRKSHLDVELADGATDAAYLQALEGALKTMFGAFDPALIIFLAGADPYAGDRLGRLALSMGGLALRDAMVFNAAWRRRIPVAVAMAGGYAQPIADTVAIQASTVQLALQAHAHWSAWRARGS